MFRISRQEICTQGSLSPFLPLSLFLFLSLFSNPVITNSPREEQSFLFLYLFISCFVSLFLSFRNLCWISKFPFKGKFEMRTTPLSSSLNLRSEWAVYLVLESSWREQFGNHFSENFGHPREMAGKSWCLVCSNDTKIEKIKKVHDTSDNWFRKGKLWGFFMFFIE